MPTLRDLQQHMIAAVLEDGADAHDPAMTADTAPDIAAAAAALLRGDSETALRRAAVYANNARSGFLDSLRSSFPAVRRLVGDDYFAQCVFEYRRVHPSRSGDLQHTGRDFADHLAGRCAGDALSWLPDVARFEWLYQETLTAADHAPFDLQRLAAIDLAAAERLRFALHPSARLFTSPYPVAEIWEANVASADEPPVIDLRQGADRLLLARSRQRVAIHRLSAGEYVFLGALARGEAFGAAAAGAADDEAFDAGAALRRFVPAEVIVDFALPGPPGDGHGMPDDAADRA